MNPKRLIAGDNNGTFTLDWVHSTDCDRNSTANDVRDCLYLCMGSIESGLSDARNSPQPDAQNLLTGCHGQDWIELRKAPPISGEYELNNGETSNLNAWALLTADNDHQVSRFDENEEWLISTDANSTTAPEGWHKYHWHREGQSVYTCRVGYDQSSESLAMLMPLQTQMIWKRVVIWVPIECSLDRMASCAAHQWLSYRHFKQSSRRQCLQLGNKW